MQSRWLRWCLAVCFWTLCGLFFGVQTYLINLHVFGQELPWTRAIPWSLSYWYTWAALAPFVLWLTNCYQFDRQSWWRALAIHFPISLLLSVLHLTLIILLNQLARVFSGTPFTLGEKFRLIFAMHFHWNVLTYWLIVASLQTLNYYRKYRERELRASQVEAQLARAELQALRMQLHPHFLFNALNSISALMYSDVSAADSMLTRLSALLRSRLTDSGVQEVTLREEVEFVEKYLEIEQIRFADRLTVRTTISADTFDAMVPNLVLQPLVENAIRHGVAQREANGLVEINATRENGILHLEVRDNGPGLAPGESPRDGIGLSNTRERLRCLYGAAHSLVVRSAAGGGTVAELTIPYYDKVRVGQDH